jgi:hypothetical protein|nr:MAG TPA: hypothetical protein [Caudoviricetes sp.]
MGDIMTLKIKMSNEDKDKFLYNLTGILEELSHTEYYQTIDSDFSNRTRKFVFANLTIEWYSGCGHEITITNKNGHRIVIDHDSTEVQAFISVLSNMWNNPPMMKYSDEFLLSFLQGNNQ